MDRLRLLLATVCVGAALTAAGPAVAATPFTAGTGDGHDVAVGPDGTAHIVWVIQDPADDKIGYCRVPAGGTACDSESTVLNFPDVPATADAQGRAQVFAPGGGTVVIVAACTQCPTGDVGTDTYRWSSANNGVTFPTSSTPVGSLAPGGEGSRLPGGEVLQVSGALFQAMPTGSAPLNLGGAGFVYSPSVVPFSGATQKAIYAVNDLATVKYRIFTDPVAPATIADFNTAGNWGSDRFLGSPEADNEETHLSAGGNGVLLSYVSSSPGDVRVGLRRLDTGSSDFGAPAYVQGSSPIDQNGLDAPHHSQDGGGRIHFVWQTLHDGGRLRYTRSDTSGANFSAPANLAARESFQDPLVEAAPDGNGFAVWHTQGGLIRVVPIDPQPEPSATPGGDSTAPGVSGASIGDSTLRPGQGTTFSFNSSEAGTAVLT